MSRQTDLPEPEIYGPKAEKPGEIDSRATETESANSAKAETKPLQIPDEEKRRLEEENEALRRELELMREKTIKERLYDHVHVSVRTMDIFIGIMVILFIAVIVMGLLNK